MLTTQRIACPYCGEAFTAEIDASAGAQEYIEDCHVCCRPIEFSVAVDPVGETVSVAVKRDDE